MPAATASVRTVEWIPRCASADREEAVQVDVLDDAHGRRREPAGGGETRDERLVRATVLLAGVLLHDQVHIGPWPVQQSIERVRDVEPPIRRPVGSGQHDHPVVRPHPELGAEGRGVRVRGRLGEVQPGEPLTRTSSSR